jgi:predicted nucleic acid-binding protein
VIAFLDTSAIVPLLIEEPSTAPCRRTWEAADAVVCTQLAFVETAAALARATRLRRMTAVERDVTTDRLEEFRRQLHAVVVDEALVREAAALTAQLPLRGYDAAHCAAALRLAGPGVVAVSGDRELLTAWRGNGLDVIDTSDGRVRRAGD